MKYSTLIAMAVLGSTGAVLSVALAANEQEEMNIQRVNEAPRFTVRVSSETSNVFDPQIELGHGTGFIAELEKDHAYVFTNSHVVSKRDWEAQRVKVGISVEKELPEVVPGKVVFRSPLYDFAVVEFDPRTLKRARTQVAVAHFPKRGADYLAKGTTVMAFGHPLDGEDISTFGQISGVTKDLGRGEYFQTTAPINPGNSGGPLINAEEGYVVGMNSIKVKDADNTGYAIPIHLLLEEFALWKQRPATYSERRHLLASVGSYETTFIERDGMKKTVEAAFPDFFNHHKSALILMGIPDDVSQKTGLKTGDIILACDGQMIGGSHFKFARMLQQTLASSVKLTVLRGAKIQTFKVPLIPSGPVLDDLNADFLIVSGMVLREQSPEERMYFPPGLLVYHVLSGSGAADYGMTPFSLVRQVQFPTEEAVDVNSLADLRKAIGKHRSGETWRMYIQQSLNSEGKVVSDPFNVPLLMSRPLLAHMPFDGAIGPREFDLEEAMAKLDFSNYDAKARDWHTYLKKPASFSCQKRLSSRAQKK